MTSTRFVLTAIALAAAQAALAQDVQPASVEAAQPPAARTQAPTAPRGAVAAPDAPGAEVAPSSASPSPNTAQPRYIQGNDQVLAPARPVSPIEGAPLSFNFEEAPVAEVARTILGTSSKFLTCFTRRLPELSPCPRAPPSSQTRLYFCWKAHCRPMGLPWCGTYGARTTSAKPMHSRASVAPYVSSRAGSGAPLPPGYGAIVVPLRFIGAGEMATILRPLAPADAIVRVDNVRNLLVLAGTRSQAEGWLDLVNTFDVDLLKGMSVGLFPLKYATIKEVEAALRLVSGSAQAPAGAPSGSSLATTAGAASAASGASAAAAMLGEGNPLFGALRVMPVERLNSILVVTPRAAYLEEARRWIEKLDQPSDNGAEAQLFIYRVQNGNAKHLASVLSGIFGSSQTNTATANSGVAPGLGGAAGTSQVQSPLAAQALHSAIAPGATPAIPATPRRTAPARP